MAISDIPSKIIEIAETLSEKKLEIAFNLTQLIHKENKDEKQVLETFNHCLEFVKDFLPQDQATRLLSPEAKQQWLVHRRRLILTALGVGAVTLLVIYMLFYLIGSSSLLKLLGVGAANLQ